MGFGAFPDDVPGRLIVRRMAAVRLRAFFLWFLTFALELERRFPGFFFWVGKRRYEKASRKAGRRIKTIPSARSLD